MRQKAVKTICSLVILIMAIGLLASCTGNTKETKSETPQKNEGEEEKPRKQLTLDMWVSFSTDYPVPPYSNDNVINKYVEDKTGIKLGNIFGNGGVLWDAKLTTLVAGGTVPHIIDNHAGDGPLQFAKLAEGDLIWELTPEMLQKYAPHIWEKTPKNQWENIKVNGKIYGIPYQFPVDPSLDPNLDPKIASRYANPVNDITLQYGVLWIRDDILKKIYPESKSYNELMELLKKKNGPIGDELVDIPIKSSQEYIDFMYKIKELNLKEGNKPVYPFGYPFGDNWVAYSILGGEMMGYSNYFYYTYWYQPDQEIKFALQEPIFKQAASVQSKMVRDKVIDPESLVHTAAQYKEKLLNGRYVIAQMNGDEINAELEKAGKPFRYRPFYKQYLNNPDFPAYNVPLSFISSRGILKTVKEEDVPQVLQWLDFLYTDEYQEASYWGPKEAGLYEELGDGKRKFKDDKYQKIYIEGKANQTDLNLKDLPLTNPASMNYMDGISKWNPAILNDMPLNYSLEAAKKFPVDSPHVTSLVMFPASHMWDPVYAKLPIVKKFLEAKQTWDDAFKIVLTAESDEDFEKKWANGQKVLDDLGVKELLTEMNKIAKPLAEKLK